MEVKKLIYLSYILKVLALQMRCSDCIFIICILDTSKMYLKQQK